MRVSKVFLSLEVGALLFVGHLMEAQSQPPSVFVGVKPCRLVDTRSAAGTFGGPVMSAKSTRNFPLPTSTACSVPATATAYSLNITVVPRVYLNFLSIWPTGATQPVVSTLNAVGAQGAALANAAIVPAGTNGSITVYVSDDSDVIIDIAGYFTSQAATTGDTTRNNTFVGAGALANSTGSFNTGVGTSALGAPAQSGASNTALGYQAMATATTGQENTAAGYLALSNGVTASYNSVFGSYAGHSLVAGGYNTAIGREALLTNADGIANTAVGVGAHRLGTGNYNIALGYFAGSNATLGDNNIEIGNFGDTADDRVLRIGTPTNQTKTFIAGIAGTTITSGSTILISTDGQLGTIASSRRYKEDIQKMGDVSDRLMQLEPVTFRYKQAGSEGQKPLQYGLIAEQVSAVYPELVVYGKDGQPETVQYHELPALLLNEIQKQRRLIDTLADRIQALEESLRHQDPNSAR